jgi:hypothetical protein
VSWFTSLSGEVAGVPFTTLLAVLVGVLVLASRVVRANGGVGTSTATATSLRRPGWVARRRARRGLRYPRGRIAVGCRSALRVVYLTIAELAGHGLAVGGPKSGKTTLLRLLIEACAGHMPVVVIDPKGSAMLAETVRAHGGMVWTIDGKTPADLLDPRPWRESDSWRTWPRRSRGSAPAIISLCCASPAAGKSHSGRRTWTAGRVDTK